MTAGCGGSNSSAGKDGGLGVGGVGGSSQASGTGGTQSNTTAGVVVTTLAGSAAASTGSADGVGAAARFYFPTGVAVNAAGDVFVADTDNDTIRKVTPAGVVTTLAGTAGSFGSADGTGAAASFHYPTGVAVNAAGDVFVADNFNNTIRKVTPAGVVTTYAGNSGPCRSDGTGTDGTGTAASFCGPQSVALDGAGNVFVADGYVIRKITPAGEVTTLAGSTSLFGNVDGTGAAASFCLPYGVAADDGGNVFVADTIDNTIRKITPAGVVTTLAGSVVTVPAGLMGQAGSADGTGTSAKFNNPMGLAVDGSGNIFVADTFNNTIRKITPAGK